MSSDLKTLEARLTIEEREQSKPLENPLPCYFNTGCCAFDDGDVTGIEVSAGEIRLVRWPDDDDNPKCKVLETTSLKQVFQAIKQ